MHPWIQRPGLLLTTVAFGLMVLAPARSAAALRAGARVVDISPTSFPVRVNAMFTERTATNVVDPLWAKALALDDGTTRLVLCVVDTCMMSRDLIDRAKEEARRRTGLPVDRMLVSATHTHSAPSAMGCLGSRVDPGYVEFLVPRISAAIIGAIERLAPARVGWAQQNDWEHTFNRRWIRRPDRMLTDPFGARNVRAHMHPGHESPDAIGPSGPVDPQLSVLALQDLDGRPLAVLANYSQHYYGSDLVSADYFGRFARHLAGLLGADDTFVGIMSQGTSGDLMWMDYSAPRREIGYDAYAREMADRAAALIRSMTWREVAPLKMAEQMLDLGYRAPDPGRLQWAQAMAAKLGERLPQTQPEIYALEAIYLHERPRTELKVQAIRIGDLAIAAWPNEVFAITGLKVKRQSPLAATFNIELANGAEGYIPPPEQHKLGGYTTWPARTAGLETNAEPQLVETALRLLEKVTGRTRRALSEAPGPYVEAVLASRPRAYWRLEEMVVPKARDVLGRHPAVYEDGVALWLPGVDGRRGHGPAEPPSVNAFTVGGINRAPHFAGGRLKAEVALRDEYSIEAWIWNGLAADVRGTTGYFLSRGVEGGAAVDGEHLGITGTNQNVRAGRLVLESGGRSWVGRTLLGRRQWHHVIWVRAGRSVRVHLDGQPDPELAIEDLPAPGLRRGLLYVGGRCDGQFNFEGKIDEVAAYRRALSAPEIAGHVQAAGLVRVGNPP